MVNGDRITKAALTEAPVPSDSEIIPSALNLVHDRTLLRYDVRGSDSGTNHTGLDSLPVLELVSPGMNEVARGRLGLPGQDPAFEEGLGYDDKLYEPMNPRDNRNSPPITRDRPVRRV